MKAAIWVRVSSDDQEAANQLPVLREWAKRRGYEVAIEYVLEGESAFNGQHRKRLQRVLQDAHEGHFQVLLVWALDRLSREGALETLQLIHRLAASGVTVASLQESWVEASGELRDLLLAIMGWVAQQESKRKSERVKAGLARRRAQGLPVGRQPGAKDKRQRRRSGYVARWERERETGSA